MSIPEEERLNRTATPLRIGYDPGAEELAPVVLEVSPILREIEVPDLNPPDINLSDVEQARELGAAEGYEVDAFITGAPVHTMRVEVGEEVERGDLVVVDEDGIARRARDERPIGVALGGDLIRLGGIRMSTAFRTGSILGSMAGWTSYSIHERDWGFPERPGERRYQYTEKFPKEVREKAWKLVEQEMSPAQYFAFMEGADIELENLAGDFRLIINKSGKFTILEGARGAGIVAQSGNVRSYKYPMGDEVSAFIDWFKHRTKELIAQWGCGTYGIVREGREGR